jgi:hypothetical protein
MLTIFAKTLSKPSQIYEETFEKGAILRELS